MVRSARELYDLQLLDWEIQEREEELADIRAKLADDTRRQMARQRLAALQRKLDGLGPPRRNSEAAIQQIERRVSGIDERMYSGVVTNPRELEAYQDERSMLVRTQRSEEDTLLDLMVDMEETQESRDEARTVFERIDGERKSEVAELGSREEALSSQLPGLRERRVSMSSEFSSQALAVYETVRRSRGGHGAALVDRRGLCQGCRLVIPTTELLKVRSGQDIVQCGSCARILIYG